jgi:hypothetical protein
MKTLALIVLIILGIYVAIHILIPIIGLILSEISKLFK